MGDFTGNVALTGTLAAMSRRKAFELVQIMGATLARDVTRRIDVLVVGSQGLPLLLNGRPSDRLREANRLQIAVTTEAAFLEGTGLRRQVSSLRMHGTADVAMWHRHPKSIWTP